jgi:hypothetical protein
MSKQKPPKKKVVTTGKKTVTTAPSARKKSSTTVEQSLEFGRQNYILMGVGAALIFLGLLLMSGGQMPSADVWDDSIIYSARRVSIAPIVILLGLGVEVYAIFKKA